MLPPVLAAAGFGELVGGIVALVTVCWTIIAGTRSWREAPARAALAEAQAKREQEALYIDRERVMQERVEKESKRADDAEANEERIRAEVSMVRDQISGLRAAKDESETQHRVELAQRDARIARLIAQIHRLDPQAVPVE
jgi:transcriptional regulator of acetoin/glycerol metabolism